MNLDDNKSLIRRFCDVVINTGNFERIEDFISPDYEEVLDGKRYPVGIEGARARIAGVRQVYPDLHLTIDRQIAEGEWVATCTTIRGTHLGEWQGMKPTGKTVMVTGVNVDRVVGGKIVEHLGVANTFRVLLEIGAIRVVREEEAGLG